MKLRLLSLAVVSAVALAACSSPSDAPETGASAAAAPEAGAMTDPAPVTEAAATPENPMVGGAPMYADRDIVDNAVNSKDHTTLVAAVKAAGLVDTLKGKGPFTVFAPTNSAFAKLPAGTVDTLVKPENKGTLTGILTYHVLPGRVTAGEINALAARNGGTATFKTVQGGTLKFVKHGGAWMIHDAKGGMSTITNADLGTSNGVIHVIDTVLMP